MIATCLRRGSRFGTPRAWRTGASAFLLAFGLLLAVSASALAAPAPDQLIRTVADTVLRTIRQDRTLRDDHRARFELLIEQEVAQHFDFERMTRLALGRNWRLASPEQRALLVQRFSALLVHSYAAAFASAQPGIKVSVDPVQLQPGETDVQVRSRIELPGNPSPLEVDYSLYKTGSAWKVYDLSVDNVDLVATYRSTFDDEISSGGVAGLLQALQNKDAQFVEQQRD